MKDPIKASIADATPAGLDVKRNIISSDWVLPRSKCFLEE